MYTKQTKYTPNYYRTKFNYNVNQTNKPNKIINKRGGICL